MFYGTTNAKKVMEKILKLLVLGTCLLKLTIPYRIYFWDCAKLEQKMHLGSPQLISLIRVTNITP
jgi:hypothetical protein